MTVRVEAYLRTEVVTARLESVARGAAAGDVRLYVGRLKRQGHHTVGDVWVDVSRVEVRGSRASISSCMTNATADVDVHDRVVERDISPAYVVTATAVRGGPRWLIDTIRFDGRSSCRTA
jgi:hypothetical protein